MKSSTPPHDPAGFRTRTGHSVRHEQWPASYCRSIVGKTCVCSPGTRIDGTKVHAYYCPSNPVVDAGIPVIHREFAGPSSDTFDVPPIAGFVQKYLLQSEVSVDPFARNKRWATYTNDLNPDTAAESHMDAQDFLCQLVEKGVKSDLVIFDPPYSPRQISECYAGIGKTVTMQDTQNCVLYSRVRSVIPELLTDDGVVLSFGWNSNGMGRKHGFEIVEILLVAHGAAHNDTICVADRRRHVAQEVLDLR